MTLSEFLETKRARTQLPSEAPLDIERPNIQKIDKDAPTINFTEIVSPEISRPDQNSLLNMLTESASNKNFNMKTLSNNKTIIPNFGLDAYAYAGIEKGLSNLLPKTDELNKNVDNNNRLAKLRGLMLVKEAADMSKTQLDNIKNTGLALDGFEGSAYVHTKTELEALTENKGTMAKGAPKTVVDGKDSSGNDKSVPIAEVLRKVHLRNYWSIATEGSLSNKSQLIPDGAPAMNMKYRELLNKRLKGVTKPKDDDTEGQKNWKGSFLTGYGLSAEQYKELILNDSVVSNENDFWGSIGNAFEKVGLGMDTKRDGLIDSGRFSYFGDAKAHRWTSLYGGGSSSLLSGNANLNITFNISTFSADPARMPFFRRQVISLGNEVNYGNAYFDLNYVSTNNFEMRYINAKDNESWYDTSKRFGWKFNGSQETRGDSTGTPTSMLMHRFPDLMGNMSYVYIINDDIEHSGDKIDIDPVRILDISVKMPELKTESIAFTNRQISVLSNSVNMSHQGNIKIRVDQELNSYMKILEHMGIEFTGLGNAHTTFLHNAVSMYSKSDSIKSAKMDLVVSYALAKGFLPLSHANDPSRPYDKDVVNYQHDDSDNIYSRYYIFKNVKFIGVPELEFAKDGEKIEASFDFVFRNIEEADTGLAYPKASES